MRIGPFTVERRGKIVSDGGRKVQLQVLDWNSFYKAAMGEEWDWGDRLSIQDCMKVSPVAAGIGFYANAIASLPMRQYERVEVEGDGNPERKRIKGGMLDDVLNYYWNDDEDAHTAKLWMIQQYFTHGVCYIFVERNLSGRILRLIPLHKSTIEVEWRDGKKRYRYDPNALDGRKFGSNSGIRYFETRDIIEIGYRYRDDRVTPVSFLEDARVSIAVYRAIEAYSAKFFGGGGVPPLAVFVPVSTSEEALRRMKDDLQSTIFDINRTGDLILPLPYGHEVKPIGVDPEKGQMIDAKKFQLTEIARFLNLSPIFLQDLTHGTFNNTEQQALHVVKHSVRPLANKCDRRFSLSLYGRGNRKTAHSDLTELTRGDVVSRFNSWARGIQGGFMTPNEARAREGLPTHEQEEADKLHMQMGTGLLGGQNNDPSLTNPPRPPDNTDDGDE